MREKELTEGVMEGKPSWCIKVWLNQLHTTVKRRFPLL